MKGTHRACEMCRNGDDSICRGRGPKTMRRQLQVNASRGVYLSSYLVVLLVVTGALVLLDSIQANDNQFVPNILTGNSDGKQQQQQQQQSTPAMQAFGQYLNQLRSQDTCGTIYTAKVHGYDVRDYLVRTNDKYELHVHRLVHPEDYMQQQGPSAPPQRKKKPYLLVHGLIGTSASWLTNVDELYRAPPVSFNAWHEIESVLRARANDYQFDWQSTAEQARRSSFHEKAKKFVDKKREYADSLELQFDGPHQEFARDFRQSYKKFQLPKAALGYTTNSLALTLANFGYDVWLINLRGNKYSRGYNGRHSAEQAEYWDFNIETIYKQDLAATIQFIQKETKRADWEPLGLVAYSYSSAHVMGLLTRLPKYQQTLKPIVLMAPTLLTGTSERGKFKYFMKLSNALISKNGPFPVWGRTLKANAKSSLLNLSNLEHRLEKLACSLPVASKLCRLLETIIHGKTKQVASVRGLLTSDRSSELMQRDIDCGQTSKQILHQIIENLSQQNIDPNFQPHAAGKQSTMLVSGRAPPVQPSIMLVHSADDEISTPNEVAKIRQTALKTLTLVDYLIREPQFGHTDFLFAQSNQYLVNAEIARMVTVHDYLNAVRANRPHANPSGGARY